jgi:hypothetical protein
MKLGFLDRDRSATVIRERCLQARGHDAGGDQYRVLQFTARQQAFVSAQIEVTTAPRRGNLCTDGRGHHHSWRIPVSSEIPAEQGSCRAPPRSRHASFGTETAVEPFTIFTQGRREPGIQVGGVREAIFEAAFARLTPT